MSKTLFARLSPWGVDFVVVILLYVMDIMIFGFQAIFKRFSVFFPEKNVSAQMQMGEPKDDPK